MIRGLGHVALTVKDMQQSLEFYCDALGFTRAFDIPTPEGKPWIVYIKVADRQFIELFYGGTDPVAVSSHSIGFNHLCLEVDDIAATADHLRQKGVKLTVEPKQGLDHNWQCWAQDPDGNRIEFMQLMPESPHMNC
ncbi:MAG: VOC family protein [Firmicutes bacterium]|nr:VOC family protein [Bacillota bacterium]